MGLTIKISRRGYASFRLWVGFGFRGGIEGINGFNY